MNRIKEDHIQIPTLFIAASNDQALPPSLSKGMEEYIPNLTRRQVDTTHWALTEAPEQVNEYIWQWLEPLLDAGVVGKSRLWPRCGRGWVIQLCWDVRGVVCICTSCGSCRLDGLASHRADQTVNRLSQIAELDIDIRYLWVARICMSSWTFASRPSLSSICSQCWLHEGSQSMHTSAKNL